MAPARPNQDEYQQLGAHRLGQPQGGGATATRRTASPGRSNKTKNKLWKRTHTGQGAHHNDGLDIDSLKGAAHKRWLKVPELIHLLTPDATPLPVSSTPPATAPPSGTLLLYDRTATRHYRNDFHVWLKKAHGKTIREDHVKLRFNGTNRVSGLYAHGAPPSSNMYRRVYHLVKCNSEEGHGAKDSSSRDRYERESNLVLVHYREIKVKKSASQTVPAHNKLKEGNGGVVKTNGTIYSPRASFVPGRGDDVSIELLSSLPSCHRRGESGQPNIIDSSSASVSCAYDVERDGMAATSRGEINFVLNGQESRLLPRQLLPEITGITPSSVVLPSPATVAEPCRVTPVRDHIQLIFSGPLPTYYGMGRCLQRYAAFVDIICGDGDGAQLIIRSVSLARLQSGVTSNGANGKHVEMCGVPNLNPGGNTQTNGDQTCYCRPVLVVSVSVMEGRRLPPLQELELTVGKVLKERCNEALEGLAESGGKPSSASLRPTFFEPDYSAKAMEGFSATDKNGVNVEVLSQFSREFFQFVQQEEGSQEANVLVWKGGDSSPNDEIAHDKDVQAVIITSWLQAPRFEYCDAQVERQTMSFNEIAEALQDIHGMSSISTSPSAQSAAAPLRCDERQLQRQKRHGILVSDHELFLFHMAIGAIPSEQKAALLRAIQLCPDELSKEHKSLFILTVESSDPNRAAEKYCRYWELRQTIFGPQKAFLPMTLDGALADDMHALVEIDICHYLPGVEDRFGRAIIYSQTNRYNPSLHDRTSVLRAIWYNFELASRSVTNPANGIIWILNLTNKSLATVDKQLVDHQWTMVEVFPLILRAHHYMGLPWYFNMLYPVVKQMIGRELRCRDVFHSGSNSEVLHSFSQYGILPHHLPVEIGGTHDVDVSRWFRMRRESGL